MKSDVLIRILLGVALAIPLAQSKASPGLLLISIDGLRPDYVSDADKHGLKIPNLRRILAEGSSATGVRGVLPTATYPSHTTLVTGVSPARHGIIFNKPFGGAVKGIDVWYYYSEDLRVPTLWDAAAKGGYIVGNVSWPVTVGAATIDFNIPEYNLTRTDHDLKMTRGVATPGLMAELEKTAGPYLTDYRIPLPRDWARTRYAVEMIRQKRVSFMLVHLAASDSIQHRSGPFSEPLFEALEEMDAMVGQLVEAIRAQDPGAAVCIVSDHGFAAVDRVLRLDAAFVKEGLITLSTRGTTVEDSTVADWIARTSSGGGSAAVILKNPQDLAARAKVKSVLGQLAADPENGIAAIFDQETIAKMGGAPIAQFWVDMRPGFILNAALNPSLVDAVSARGAHGYSPNHREMDATLIIAGKGIRRGHDLGRIDMRGIAPTLAKFMNVSFPSAELPPLDVFEAPTK